MAIILYLSALKKDLSIFIRINSIGTLFTLTIIAFVIGMGVYALKNTSFDFVFTLDQSATTKASIALLTN
jgi:hypothetical protein